jgi:hypothetical protein
MDFDLLRAIRAADLVLITEAQRPASIQPCIDRFNLLSNWVVQVILTAVFLLLLLLLLVSVCVLVRSSLAIHRVVQEIVMEPNEKKRISVLRRFIFLASVPLLCSPAPPSFFYFSCISLSLSL